MQLMKLIVERLVSLLLPLCLVAGSGDAQPVTPQLSVMEAADYLYETCFAQNFPDAQRVDTEAFQGYILSPLRDLGKPGGQQVAIELCHYQTSDSGEYYVFWFYENLVDYPETGDGHCVTWNFYAVSTQEDGPILMERDDPSVSKDDPEFDAAWDVEWARRSRFGRVVDGEEPLAEDDPLIIHEKDEKD